MGASLNRLACARVALIVLAVAPLAYPARGRALSFDGGPQLAGDWAGESVCTGVMPACRDEKVIYRLTDAPDS